MNINKWLKNNYKDLSGKTVVITGATGGLGREVCFLLAEFNANLVLACRNENLAEQLIAEINQKYPKVNVEFVYLDFGNLKSVKSCLKELVKYNGIDLLINNAGVYNVKLKQLDSGFNNIFQINFVYVYYFTKKLIFELEKKENSKCITVGSIAHNYSKIDEKDIDFSSRKKQSKIYGNSKRFLMFSFFELFKNSKVKLSIVHPGITLTKMTSHYPWAINWFVKIFVKVLFPNPKKATLNIIYAINNDTNYNEWIGPKILNIWGFPKISKLKTCKKDESDKIFEIAEKIYSNIK